MAFVTSVPVTMRMRAAPMVSSFKPTWTAYRPRTLVKMTPSMNLETIQTKIQEEMRRAQEATEKYGKTSKEAAMAWDVVEELEAEASHLKANQEPKDPLEEYCEDAPEADECRVYDN
eukprot:GFKZ01005671.1.p1 GENE.GFKZ01005671.1~~GFKZ01005671.1.p1  ORF type:complete len:117 (+),score=25.97 GFKZ01005671.1:596-946(+)